MVIGMCYKAALNHLSKWDHEHDKHIRVIEKKQHADMVVKTLAEERPSEEEIEQAVGTLFMYFLCKINLQRMRIFTNCLNCLFVTSARITQYNRIYW